MTRQTRRRFSPEYKEQAVARLLAPRPASSAACCFSSRHGSARIAPASITCASFASGWLGITVEFRNFAWMGVPDPDATTVGHHIAIENWRRKLREATGSESERSAASYVAARQSSPFVRMKQPADRVCACWASVVDIGSVPNIPPKVNRRWKNCFSPCLYRGRNAIELMFGRLKDFRRIAIRYDRLAENYLAAICLAATVTYWL